MASEEARQPAQAYRDAIVLQRGPHLAQVGLRSFLKSLQDQGRVPLDTMRVPVSAHRPGGDLAVRPEAGMPADRARLAHAKPCRRLSAGGPRLNGSDHPLAKIQR